jgi:hypothetical protein
VNHILIGKSVENLVKSNTYQVIIVLELLHPSSQWRAVVYDLLFQMFQSWAAVVYLYKLTANICYERLSLGNACSLCNLC